jgi:3-hydroxyisobutyrate dehydrogenase-like beta-hydroxyacid dehydrogenase
VPDDAAGERVPGPRPALGWLGTGRMGAAMARRLLGAGAELAVWNRTRSKAEPLLADGAVVLGSLAELAAAADVVFVMVAAPADLAQVTIGDGGLLSVPRRRVSLVVDCSTVSATVSAEVRAGLRAAGIGFLACPMSGNPRVVEAGGSSMVVSGPRADFERIRWALQAISASVLYVGQDEESRLVKLAHNLFLGMVVGALVEVTTLAEKGGVGRETFLEFLNGTGLSSPWVRARSPDLIAWDWTPTFTTELLRKDFGLGLDAARDLAVPMPVAAAVYQLIQTAIGYGLGEADFLSLAEVAARGAGLPYSAGG